MIVLIVGAVLTIAGFILTKVFGFRKALGQLSFVFGLVGIVVMIVGGIMFGISSAAKSAAEKAEAARQAEAAKQAEIIAAPPKPEPVKIEKFVVAIAPFDIRANLPDNADATVRVAIMSGLRENAAAEHFTFVDTTQIDKIMQQHNFEASDWSSGEKVAEIGAALNARILVTGTVNDATNGMDYTITMLDINTMEVLGTSLGTIKNIKDIADEADTMKITLPLSE